MQIAIILFLSLMDVVLVICSWRFFRKDPSGPHWRRRVAQASLILVTASSAAFIFHLVSGVLDLPYLPRGPFDRFVELCILGTLLSMPLSILAKGPVRYTMFAAGLIVGYLWLLVAALSFM